MMGKRSSAPAPPDPNVTAGAQTSTNVATALANASLQNINQVTPDGSRIFTKDENDLVSFTDPNSGETFNIPRTTETITLSPEQQAIQDQNNATELNLGTLANNLSGTLGDRLTENFTIDNDSTEARLFDLGNERLAPEFERREDDLRTRLANQGIAAGSSAFNRELERFDRGRNDAFNQLALSGRGQAANEQLTEDNQRINQISALLSGSQVSQPNFNPVNQPQLPTVDIAGLQNQNFQQQNAIFQQNQQGSQGILGGLFGLGASAITGGLLGRR